MLEPLSARLVLIEPFVLPVTVEQERWEEEDLGAKRGLSGGWPLHWGRCSCRLRRFWGRWRGVKGRSGWPRMGCIRLLGGMRCWLGRGWRRFLGSGSASGWPALGRRPAAARSPGALPWAMLLGRFAWSSGGCTADYSPFELIVVDTRISGHQTRGTGRGRPDERSSTYRPGHPAQHHRPTTPR